MWFFNPATFTKQMGANMLLLNQSSSQIRNAASWSSLWRQPTGNYLLLSRFLTLFRLCVCMCVGERWGTWGGGMKSRAPAKFECLMSINPRMHLALNFCSLNDYQKLWHNCSLFVKTSFDPN